MTVQEYNTLMWDVALTICTTYLVIRLIDLLYKFLKKI